MVRSGLVSCGPVLYGAVKAKYREVQFGNGKAWSGAVGLSYGSVRSGIVASRFGEVVNRWAWCRVVAVE